MFFYHLIIYYRKRIPPYFISDKTDSLVEEFKCCLISEGDFNLVPSFIIVNEGSAITATTTFNGGPNYFFWIFASQIFRSLLFFLSFELTCIMNYNISVAFLLIFYFLAFIWVNTNWWMVNSKNYLITYVWNVFLFHLNLLAAWIMLFLLYICQLFLKRAVSFWIISL